MFNEEEDWNDDQDSSQPLPQVVCKDSGKTNSKKLVGKKSLMRTLQSLGSVPEWKNEEHQQGSDSEAESAPPSGKRKRKKKRSKKKRRRGKTSEEQQANGDVDQSVKEEKPVQKQNNKYNKFGAKRIKLSAGETKEKDITNSTKTDTEKAGSAQKLNRQQWKNKMKNKRKCQNKYRQNQAAGEEIKAESAEEPPEPKEAEKKESKTDSCSNKNSKKSSNAATKTCSNKNNKKSSETADRKKKRETESKPQKRKQAEVDTDIPSASQTQMETKGTNEAPVITDDPVPEKKPRPELSKEQTLKRERLRRMLQNKETEQREVPAEQPEVPAEPSDEPPAPAEEVKLDRSASLRARMEQRLESARFRYINEVLYSTTSGEAKRMFKQDPQAFWVYHRGYTAQVQRWPTNPLDAIISYIQQKSPTLVVADFSCGDCKIARSVNNKVHSFDLASTCELVTVCDMADVPLPDSSVDIAVFCLSLMGTNLADFLAEANRVLKMGGVLKIAEVASRFENVRNFITALANLGFKMVLKDTENTHFYSFECVKTGNAPESVRKFGLQLRPCLYKKR